MKKTIFLLILFYANYTVAQLKVEQLTNDSLMKVFISQQTGKKFQDLHFMTLKELRDRRVIGVNSKLDSIKTEKSLIADFNKDGKQDLVVSYAERTPSQKYVDGFYVMTFVSTLSGDYKKKNLWGEYDHLYGSPVQLLSNPLSFVLARLEYEFREEKIRYDTLKYFQGEFVNVNDACVKAFDSIKYYRSSNWVSSSHQYSHLTVFPNMTMKREDFSDGNKRIYTCSLKVEVFDSLYKLICQVNVWNLKDSYEMKSISDAGTSHLVIGHRGVVKTIDDYGHWGNFGLGALYKVLNRLSSEAQWTLSLPPKIEYQPRKIGKLN